MRRSASEVIRNLEMRVANLEKQATRYDGDLYCPDCYHTPLEVLGRGYYFCDKCGHQPHISELDASGKKASSSKSNLAIETSSQREIERAWPNLSYQGKGHFQKTYISWINRIESNDLSEGQDAEGIRDYFDNALEYWTTQECYLGYVQSKDYFVMGFDLTLYAPESVSAWSDHQDAMEEYRGALQKWEEADDDADEPIEDDFRGYDYDYEGESDPSEGVVGWASVVFRVENGRINVVDIHVDGGGDNFFTDGHRHTKKQHRDIIDIRLD